MILFRRGSFCGIVKCSTLTAPPTSFRLCACALDVYLAGKTRRLWLKLLCHCIILKLVSRSPRANTENGRPWYAASKTAKAANKAMEIFSRLVPYICHFPWIEVIW